MITPELTIAELSLLGAICLLFIIQICYYFLLYSRIYRRNTATNNHTGDNPPPLSIIIYAKDELYNLSENLPLILEQDYPEFEVIVINDDPTDGSDDYLQLQEKKYKNLYHSFVPNSSRYISHKKIAVTLGVKASKYDWLVFTDANCRPSSDKWLRLLARNMTDSTDIVLGCYIYDKKARWVNKKISFDTLFSSMRVLSFALAGKPYSASGRNMAYRKELFYKNKGFANNLSLQRGDDDIFVNQMATGDNTRVETNADAVVRIKAVSYAKLWREDKLNYIVTSKFYKGAQKYLCGFETLSRLLLLLGLLASLVYGIIQLNYILIAAPVLLWGLRYTVQLAVINKTAASIGDKERYYFSIPLFDILQPFQSFKFRLHCMLRNKSEFMRR